MRIQALRLIRHTRTTLLQQKVTAPLAKKSPVKRPVFQGRMASPLYKRVANSAQKNGRSISEEIEWRVEASFTKARPSSASIELSLKEFSAIATATLHQVAADVNAAVNSIPCVDRRIEQRMNELEKWIKDRETSLPKLS